MAKTKGSEQQQPARRPETKAQRQARLDSAHQCPDCPASFATVEVLGVHAASAHTAGMGC